MERSVSFEEIVLAIEADGLIVDLPHPNRSVLVVTFDDYVYLVPYVGEVDYFFLKTVIPSRKATKDYMTRNNPEEKPDEKAEHK